MSKSRTRSKRRKRYRNIGDILPLPLLLVLGGLILVGGAFFSLWKFGQSDAALTEDNTVTGSPSLMVDREIVDLGNVPVNKPVSVSFQLANVGDKPLRFGDNPFVEVRAGC